MTNRINYYQELPDAQQPVNQIAELVGYFGRSYFSRYFICIHPANLQLWRNASRSYLVRRYTLIWAWYSFDAGNFSFKLRQSNKDTLTS